MSFVHLGRGAAVARMEQLDTEMRALHGSKHRLSRAEQAEFDQLGEEFGDLERHVRQIDRAAEVEQGLRSGRFKLQAGTPGGEQAPEVSDRDRALRTLERHVSTGALPAAGAEKVEALLTTGSTPVQSWTARYAAAAGDDAYMRAFAKLVGDPTRGHLTWTPDEHDAYRRVAALATEQRALGVDASYGSGGGYMVPLTLDPAIQLTSDGSTNPMRQLSRVVQTVGLEWQGVTSAGVTAEWTAEAAQMADATPTLAGPSIKAHKGDAFVPFSFEVEGDAIGFMEELAKLLGDAADQLTADAYTVGLGDGSNQPKGVITAVAAASPSVKVDPDTAEVLTAADVYTVQNALGPRFQAGAAWTANLAVLNALRQFETTNGALKFPELSANPATLLGRPVFENSNMGGLPDADATAQNYPLLYGDFAQGYVIADRIGSTIELVPHLFGADRRPTGQRGALLWFRTGGDVVNANAFRVLSIPTTA